jgi:hypothetical protein
MNKIIVKKLLTVLLIVVGMAVLAVAVRYTFWPLDISLTLKIIFFVLLGGDAICYFVAAWGVAKNVKWLYPFTIALLVINTLGAIFDDIGLADIIASGINIVLLIMLIYVYKK